MKLIVPGGTGQIGALVARDFARRNWDVVVLSRSGAAPPGARGLTWDARTLGAWAKELDGADAVLNLAGRSVDCRYTEKNLREMMDSRVSSTRVVGEAIAASHQPPAVWLQMSTATIYAHRFDADNDEATGIIGGEEPDVPAYWARSIEIAKAWERTLSEAATPRTRKLALRTSMVMSADRGGIFDVLRKLTIARLGGPIGGGNQYVSWIHSDDFVRALHFLIAHPELDGAVNVCAPHPLPQRKLMEAIRAATHVGIGLPATRWMAEIGAFFLRTDTELLLKSRRVVPARLLAAGFHFEHAHWSEAASALLAFPARQA